MISHPQIKSQTKLSSSEEPTVNSESKYLSIGNPNVSAGELEELSTSPWMKVRMRVAEHPNTPSHVLLLLAKDVDPEVRMSVANNPNVTMQILSWLTNDEAADVRFYLAEDPKLPRHLLVKLSQDENPYVVQRAELTLSRALQSYYISKNRSPLSMSARRRLDTSIQDILRLLYARNAIAPANPVPVSYR